MQQSVSHESTYAQLNLRSLVFLIALRDFPCNSSYLSLQHHISSSLPHHFLLCCEFNLGASTCQASVLLLNCLPSPVSPLIACYLHTGFQTSSPSLTQQSEGSINYPTPPQVLDTFFTEATQGGHMYDFTIYMQLNVIFTVPLKFPYDFFFIL